MKRMNIAYENGRARYIYKDRVSEIPANVDAI